MEKIKIYDTTLRDGSQGDGIIFSLEDKLKTVFKLDKLGVRFIEGGWPGANPKDTEFFERAKKIKLENSIIVAFGMTCRKGTKPSENENLRKLLDADTKIVTIFGKSWELHIYEVLKTDLNENLRLIEETCAFFYSRGRRVFYDAEHFFDGFKNNPVYALKTLRAAERGGAETVILCDTNGGTLPSEISQAVNEAQKAISVPLGIHSHNDGGLALANTLAAVESGVRHIQGTFNGLGERCGNADLCSIIPTLQLKMKFNCLPSGQLSRMTEISRFIDEIANLKPVFNRPYVGRSAFAHKGGIHVNAVFKKPEAYEHISPSLVGNARRVLVSELSGASNISEKAKEFGIKLSSRQIQTVLNQVKELENQGFQFEAANASLELLMWRTREGYKSPFEFSDFKVVLENHKNKGFISVAKVNLLVKNKIVFGKAEGNGPVNALDNAFRKALLSTYPEIKNICLTDYKVRILGAEKGTEARVRVLIDSSSNGVSWTTVGSSTDVVKASWRALSDSLEYAILSKII